MPFGRIGRPGLIGSMARTAVVAGTATAVAGRVGHHQQEKYAQKEQAQYEQQQAMAAAAAPAAEEAPAYLGELQQLAQLKSQGIITEDEFQAKKRQLLGI